MRKFLCISFFIVVSTLFGQTNNAISGIVYEGSSDNNAVFFANVTLKETKEKITTDFRGQYNFTDILPGEYTLVFQFLGCETITQKIIVDNESIKIDAHLSKAVLFIDDDMVGVVKN